ncbi:hypothetical protein [Terriglobus sp. RCC_193]|uniref:hypothetical protein n=1 Tax=Terriglobus sp. RCC_193 TaxID=3239218 RepID=UPI003525CD91
MDLAESIQARVATGKFASENDLIVHDLREVDDFSRQPDELPGFSMTEEEWDKELQRRVEALDAGLESTYTLREVDERFKAMREEYLRG